MALHRTHILPTQEIHILAACDGNLGADCCGFLRRAPHNESARYGWRSRDWLRVESDLFHCRHGIITLQRLYSRFEEWLCAWSFTGTISATPKNSSNYKVYWRISVNHTSSLLYVVHRPSGRINLRVTFCQNVWQVTPYVVENETTRTLPSFPSSFSRDVRNFRYRV